MSTSEKENNPARGKGESTDSKLIGPRQEYRRTGTAPDDGDAMAGKNHGKPSTPYPY
jgi:hypothetical protein